jgi:hypothetical protein
MQWNSLLGSNGFYNLISEWIVGLSATGHSLAGTGRGSAHPSSDQTRYEIWESPNRRRFITGIEGVKVGRIYNSKVGVGVRVAGVSTIPGSSGVVLGTEDHSSSSWAHIGGGGTGSALDSRSRWLQSQ